MLTLTVLASEDELAVLVKSGLRYIAEVNCHPSPLHRMQRACLPVPRVYL